MAQDHEAIDIQAIGGTESVTINGTSVSKGEVISFSYNGVTIGNARVTDVMSDGGGTYIKVSGRHRKNEKYYVNNITLL